MPITVYPSRHFAEAAELPRLVNGPNEIFARCTPGGYQRPRGSLAHHELANILPLSNPPLTLHDSSNGFVVSVINAYNKHLHLVIRPDDVWIAILIQLGFYKLQHEGQFSGPMVHFPPLRFQKLVYSHGQKAEDLLSTLEAKLKAELESPALVEWLRPCFSTTTQTDKIVAYISFIGSKQHCSFDAIPTSCGFPSVTLQGERKDWIKLCEKIEHIPKLGDQPTAFHKLLKPVLKRFVQTFDHPCSNDTLRFWQTAVDKIPNGTGRMAAYHGWITAFCFWKSDGECIATDHYLENIDYPKPYDNDRTQTHYWSVFDEDRSCLQLDDARYHRVRVGEGENDNKLSISDVPLGYSTVPIVIASSQLSGDETVYDGTLIGGHFLMCLFGEGKRLQPLMGWLVFEDRGEENGASWEHIKDIDQENEGEGEEGNGEEEEEDEERAWDADDEDEADTEDEEDVDMEEEEESGESEAERRASESEDMGSESEDKSSGSESGGSSRLADQMEGVDL